MAGGGGHSEPVSDDPQARFRQVDGSTAAGIAEAADVLRAGGLVVHPTSTVYGIGGAATAALDREIARLKGRSSGTPLIRLAPSVESLRTECPELEWDDRARRLAAEFWPGSLTLVLGDGTSRGLAARVDSHPVAAALLARWGHLMSSTSLNPHGAPPCRTPESVASVLGALPTTEVPIVFVDAGPLPEAAPSTVVSLLARSARVLRTGAVRVEDVQRCIEEVQVE